MINKYIRSVRLNKNKIENFLDYPFCLPVIRSLDNLDFHPKVTFIVGENGIYILDEPEAALSPSRQMVLLSRIHDLTKQGCQFIIATHSPILMAYPYSVIYEIKDEIKRFKYEETDHYTLTKSFLNNPGKMLDILMED